MGWTRSSKVRPLFMVALALAVGICMAVAGLFEKNRHSAAQEAAPDQLPTFRYLVMRPGKVTLTTELPGRVSAFTVSEVRPQVSGIITERLFTEGADVVAGQVLYQIDPAVFRAACNSAKAALAKAEANERAARLLAGRYAKIVKSNAVSRQEYDDALAAYAQAKADVESAKQALETAQINLGYTQIKAPVSGRIGRSQITPGALATQHQQEPLATIQQFDRVYVDMTHSNSAMLKLRRAHVTGELQGGARNSAPVRLLLEDGTPYLRIPRTDEERLEPEEIRGELLFSEITIEKSTGVVTIRAVFENPDNILLPGMFVRALVEEGRRDDAILAPQKTVMRDTRGRAYVYVLTKEPPAGSSDHSASMADDAYYVAMRHVEIDRHYNNNWLISSGLEPGDLLPLEGLQKVRPGSLVAGLPTAAETETANNSQAR